MKNKKQLNAFTLIELLIVMAVVAILVAIIIPSFKGMQEEGWITQAEQEVQTLQTAVESYYRHNGKFPDNVTGSLLSAKPQIVYKELKDPWKSAGSSYGYVTGNDSIFGDYYIIYSQGIDKIKNVAWDATLQSVTKSNTASPNDVAASNAPIKF